MIKVCLPRHKIHVCCDKHTFVVTKYMFCRDKHVFVVTKVSLSRHNFCRDKHNFVTTKICLSRHVLSRPASFCRDKRGVLSRQTCGCRDKHVFVTTKLLSRQKLYLWQLTPMTCMSSTDTTRHTFGMNSNRRNHSIRLLKERESKRGNEQIKTRIPVHALR